MNKILLSCFIFFFGISNSEAQNIQDVQYYFNKGAGCKQSPAFEKDKKSGVVKLYLDGSDGLHRHSDTYIRLMFERYKCQVVRTDLFVIEEHMGCYNSFSIPYLRKKYGNNIFKITMQEANKMDREGGGDSWAKLKQGQDSLIRNYFYETVHPNVYESFLQSKYKGMSLYLFMYCDPTGKIYKTALSGKTSEPFDSALMAAAKDVPYLVIPALDNGRPAEGRISLSVSFTAETKRRYFDSARREDH